MLRSARILEQRTVRRAVCCNSSDNQDEDERLRSEYQGITKDGEM